MPPKRPSLFNSKEIFDRVKFRTKFEVSLAEWNPKIDLLAIGSREGDVVVKRYLWKTGWKRNFSRGHPLKQFEALIDGSSASLSGPSSSSKSSKKDELISLCWSPDGQLLLATFASGRCFYLDAQTGNTLFIRALGYMPTKISWQKCGPRKMKCNKFLASGEERVPISANDFDFREDAPKEHGAVCANLELFYTKALGRSMAGTFLAIFHQQGSETAMDIFADGGILFVQRVCIDQAAGVYPRLAHSSGVHGQGCTLKKGRLRVAFDYGEAAANGIKKFLLQLPTSYTPTRLRIYSHISECFGQISFCCLYLREMLAYCGNNWQQASEAFHQRLFAIVNSHRSPRTVADMASTTPNVRQHRQSAKEGALEMCRHLLVVLDDGEASDLLDKFFSHPTTEKELKQAASFVEDFKVLIKGISSGLLPATHSLRHAIRSLRAHLTNLAMNLEEEEANEKVDPAKILLDTLLRIANGHPAFEPVQNLGQHCEQFLADFEEAIVGLERKLQAVLELAERNRRELEMLVHWLVALIYLSSNPSTTTVDESLFDVKLLNQFISEVVDRSGLNGGGSQEEEDTAGGGIRILDRVYAHLVTVLADDDAGDRQSPMDLDEQLGDEEEEHMSGPLHAHLMTTRRKGGQSRPTTLGQHLDKCFHHFRTLYADGITKIVHLPVDLEKCSTLPAGGDDEEEEDEDDHHHPNDDDGGEESEEKEGDEMADTWEEQQDEEMMAMSGAEEKMRRRKGDREEEGKLTLHAFIFGYDQSHQQQQQMVVESTGK